MDILKIILAILISVAASFFITMKLTVEGLKKYAKSDAMEKKQLLDLIDKGNKEIVKLKNRVSKLENKHKAT